MSGERCGALMTYLAPWWPCDRERGHDGHHHHTVRTNGHSCFVDDALTYSWPRVSNKERDAR